MTSDLAGLNMDPSEIIAALVVCLYARNRFNTPKTARSQTSQVQYFLSCIAYIASCFGLFMLLTWAVAKSPNTLDFLSYGDKAHALNDFSGLDAALIAALVLTTLLPTFPLLRDIDAWLLRFFHKLGYIPINAVRWAQRMKEAELRISPERMDEIGDYIKNAKILHDSLAQKLQPDKHGDPARYIFTRNLAIYVALGNLDGYPRFAEDYPADIEAFEKKIIGFFAQSVGFFALTDQQPWRETELASEQVGNAYTGYREVGLDVYDDIRQMLARVLLYSCRSEYDVAAQLRLIGFSVQCRAPVRIPHNLLAQDLVGVVILFVATGFLSGYISGSSHNSVGQALMMAFMVAVKQSLAAAFAVLPKQVRIFAIRRSATDERPFLAYIISGVLALTIVLALSKVFYLFRDAIAWHPMLPFALQCRWLLLPFVLAIVLAYECDDYAGEREPVWLSFAESAALAGVMSLSGLFVVYWLQQDADNFGAAQLHHPTFLTPALLSAAIGALFGATIPRWYRKTLRSPGAPPESVPVRQHQHDVGKEKLVIPEQAGSGPDLWWDSEAGGLVQQVADGPTTVIRDATADEMVVLK